MVSIRRSADFDWCEFEIQVVSRRFVESGHLFERYLKMDRKARLVSEFTKTSMALRT